MLTYKGSFKTAKQIYLIRKTDNNHDKVDAVSFLIDFMWSHLLKYQTSQ